MIKREDFIARIQHIGWVSYQIADGQEYNEDPNGDQLESLLNGIEWQDKHPDVSPEDSHINWMNMKIKQGWIYGEVKDFDKMTHPDLVPFNELPETEQRKDTNHDALYRMAVKMWDDINFWSRID